MKFQNLLAFACMFWAVDACAELTGRVVGVIDGDTLTVLDAERRQHKIRLAGIDAPERGQPFGSRSKRALFECAFGKQVRVIGTKTDRYQRFVGKILHQGVDCNLQQIERGLAWHYKQYEREQLPHDRAAYALTEVQAREASKGLWSEYAPEAPWEYRRRKRTLGNP